jgi:Fic family protein
MIETSTLQITPGILSLVAEIDEFKEARHALGTLAPERLSALLAIGIFVVVFLAIHPFQDGNSRLNRVLTTLLLLRAGYLVVPYKRIMWRP